MCDRFQNLKPQSISWLVQALNWNRASLNQSQTCHYVSGVDGEAAAWASRFLIREFKYDS